MRAQFSPPVRSSRRAPGIRTLILVLFLIGAVVTPFVVHIPSPMEFRAWSERSGDGFVFLFAFIYIVATQLPIPRTVFTLSAGLLFGVKLGVAVALTATTLSAALSIAGVRFLLSDWVRQRLTHPAVKRINEHLEHRGWVSVISLRMIAGIPFSVLNYAAAASAVPIGMFTFATLVGSAPGTIATVALGAAFVPGGHSLTVTVPVFLAIVGICVLVIDGSTSPARHRTRHFSPR